VKKTNLVTLAALGLTCLIWTVGARATEAGDWLVRAGVNNVDPQSNNSDVVEVDSAASLVFDVTYMFSKHGAVELLASAPFNHDIRLLDGTKVGETDHLPPTLSVQYHFVPDSRWRPYVGIGINWTLFFNEDTKGPLNESDLDLDDSFGVAYQAGLDITLTDRWFLNADLRWMSISTDAKLDGEKLDTVSINPWVYGMNVGYRF